VISGLSTAQLTQVVAPKTKEVPPHSEGHRMVRTAGNGRDPVRQGENGLENTMNLLSLLNSEA
jgi:hypothetical protein